MTAPLSLSTPTFRLSFLWRFVIFLLPVGIFVVAAIAGGAFVEPEWSLAAADTAVEQARRQEVRWLQDYLRFDTSNPPGHEEPAARYLASILEGEGVAAELICPEPGRCNLVARIAGEVENGGLALVHHIDVVPADGSGWPKPPFSGELDGEYIVGRGSIDAKSVGIAYLEAFLAVHRSGRRPRHPLVLIADIDEENLHQKLGVRWLVEARPDVFAGVEFALNEGGVTETLGRSAQYIGLELGQPSVGEFDLIADHRPALDGAITRLRGLEFPIVVVPAVRSYFRAISHFRKAVWADRIDDLERALEDPLYRSWFPGSYLAFLQSHLTIASPRSERGQWRAKMVLRVPVDQGVEASLARLQAQIAGLAGVQLEALEVQPTSQSSPYPTRLGDAVAAVARRSFSGAHIGPYLSFRVSTTSKYLRRRGIVAYGLSPFALSIEDAQRIHHAGERIRVVDYLRGVEFLRQVVARMSQES